MRSPQAFTIAWTLLSTLLGGAAASGSEEAAIEERKLWAYPGGVIATARMTPPARVGPTQKDQIERIAGSLQPVFRDCLERLRSQRPDFADGQRRLVTINVSFAADGEVDEVDLDRAPPPELIECAARVMVRVKNARLTPLPSPRRLVARLVVDGVLLTDAEAQGSGFMYFKEQETRDSQRRPVPPR